MANTNNYAEQFSPDLLEILVQGTLTSRIVGGIISSITAICFPETSTKVDPAPTSSPYRFNSSVREKMK